MRRWLQIGIASLLLCQCYTAASHIIWLDFQTPHIHKALPKFTLYNKHWAKYQQIYPRPLLGFSSLWQQLLPQTTSIIPSQIKENSFITEANRSGKSLLLTVLQKGIKKKDGLVAVAWGLAPPIEQPDLRKALILIQNHWPNYFVFPLGQKLRADIKSLDKALHYIILQAISNPLYVKQTTFILTFVGDDNFYALSGREMVQRYIEPGAGGV